MTLTTTPYGTASAGPDGAEVSATFAQLYEWAHRPGATWPCSELAQLDTISVEFAANGDLIDITATADGDQPVSPDLSADELTAWTSDVLREAGLEGHPAIR